jgi:hypothetical protein
MVSIVAAALVGACGAGKTADSLAGSSAAGTSISDYAIAAVHQGGVLTRCSEGIDDVVLFTDSSVNVGRSSPAAGQPCIGPGGTFAQIVGFAVGAKQVAGAGAQGFVLMNDGSLWAWGDRTCGVLGDGQAGGRVENPSRVSGLNAIASVATGDHFSLALDRSGNVFSWGLNTQGALGLGNAAYDLATCSNPLASGDAVFLAEANLTPRVVPSLSNVAAIVADGSTAYALDLSGVVYQWGLVPESLANNPQLDPGKWRAQRTPAAVASLAPAVAIGASAGNAFAVLADGSVWAWGANLRANLGNGTKLSQPSPVQVSGLAGAKDVAGDSLGGVVALLLDGTIRYWDGTTNSTPVAAADGSTQVCQAANRTIAPTCKSDTLPKIERLKGAGLATLMFGADGSVYSHSAGTSTFDRLWPPPS